MKNSGLGVAMVFAAIGILVGLIISFAIATICSDYDPRLEGEELEFNVIQL